MSIILSYYFTIEIMVKCRIVMSHYKNNDKNVLSVYNICICVLSISPDI